MNTANTANTTIDTATTQLAYEAFVSDPPVNAHAPLLPNGEPKGGSPVASTLIYGSENAVLTDPAFTTNQAQALGDWVASKDRNLTDIVITHGHGDHWFAAGVLAQRFGARILATPGTIEQMHASAAVRGQFWDKLYPGIIATAPAAATTPTGNRFTLEGHDLDIVDVGHADTDANSVLHVPDLGLVVAGDVIYNGAHLYLGESLLVGGLDPWRAAIDKVAELHPRHIIAGHQNRHLDDDAQRLIAETREYLDDADHLLHTEQTALDFFDAKIAKYPNHLARTVLWVTAQALYGARENPDADLGELLVASWL